MPLDGLSSSNTGMFRFITPTENVLQAEHVAQADSEQLVKKSEKGEKSKSELDKESEEKQRDLQGRDTSEDTTSEENEILTKGKESIKKYKVSFNPVTEMVEFVDRETGVVIENMTPQDLLGLVSKSIRPSGILVDREI